MVARWGGASGGFALQPASVALPGSGLPTPGPTSPGRRLPGRLWDEWTPIHVRSAFYDYWPSATPLAFPDTGSYADPDAPVQAPFEYAWQHSMGEIISSLAAAGLRIEYLHEHSWVPWKMFPFMVEAEPGSGIWRLPEPDDARLPVLYSLKATKA